MIPKIGHVTPDPARSLPASDPLLVEMIRQQSGKLDELLASRVYTRVAYWALTVAGMAMSGAAGWLLK